MPVELKQIGVGDSAVTFGSGERPKYQAQARLIDDVYANLLVPLSRLEESVFLALGLEEPAKAEPVFRYKIRQRDVIDRAIDLFLTEMAGPVRTREGFVLGGPASDTPDGVMQQAEVQAFATGLGRGAELAGGAVTIAPARTSPQVMAMLNNAFTRLSENGALRLEKVRDDVHSILVSAQDAGISPIDTARQISKQFDHYNRSQFETLARTEAAYASEEGNRLQMRDLGVRFVKWLISSGACPICTAYVGQLIPIDDAANQPPIHPNCMCSCSPVEAEDLQ